MGLLTSHKPTTTGHGRDLWPVLLVLLAAALVPTACVLWFMNAAMSNERLAVRQRLTDAYRQQAIDASEAIEEHWTGTVSAINEGRDLPPAQRFAELVKSRAADSVIIYDEAGSPAYPTLALPLAGGARLEPTQWAEAARLEHKLAQLREAADAYTAIAKEAEDAGLQAQALQAQARCLAKAGLKDQAVAILTGPLADPKYRDALDAQGRLIAPAGQLLAMQLIGDPEDSRANSLAGSLSQRLKDYGHATMRAAQRGFLMRQLQELRPDGQDFPTLEAEQLAVEYLAEAQPPAKAKTLTKTKSPGIWQMASADVSAVALFREEGLIAELRSTAGLDALAAGITVELVSPGGQDRQEPFLAAAVSEFMPGWRLAVHLVEDPFAAAASRQVAMYLWTGSLGILVIAILAVAVARHLGRQVKLTRLRNDLIATVSHELKTPLASMRVLIDTLLEGRCGGEKQANEYFRLMAKENARLSRLIDNFLTFSRMERNKKAFDYAHVEAAEVVEAAVDSMADRFAGPGCSLDVQIAPHLPQIYADKDAVVTVLLNLLDNAWKYSGDRKVVKVRADSADGGVLFEVSDNGVGMSGRAARRIFSRFYQVDQTLSRSAGGCGLGLSIVKFIIDAHDGSVDVASQPGKGSTFTVRLPVAASAAAGGPEREAPGGK